MPQTYAAILAALKTKIEGLKDSDNKPLYKAVYGYLAGDIKDFPAATLEIDFSSAVRIDTHRNERTWKFKLKIYQEMDVKDRDAAQAVMVNCLDKTIAAFDQDPNLGQLVAKINAVLVEPDTSPTPGALVFAQFSIEAVDLVNTYAT